MSKQLEHPPGSEARRVMAMGNQAPEEIFRRLMGLAQATTYVLSDIWYRSREAFGTAWVEEIVDNVVRVFGAEHEGGWEAAIRGYAEFSLDGMRHQEFFESNGRYKRSTLKEIQEPFYENEAYMMTNYLPGMLMTHYLWPHHFKLLSFFRKEVLREVVLPPVRFCDMGIGPGVYSREMLRRFPTIRGTGYDISPYSIAFTRRVLRAYGLLDRYECVQDDLLTTKLPSGTADFLVSQEVLEHLERPELFLRKLHDFTKPGGKAYITAAINAGLSDHIYLFRSPQEVQAMLSVAGWKILKWRAEYAYSDSPLDVTPCVAAFFCER